LKYNKTDCEDKRELFYGHTDVFFFCFFLIQPLVLGHWQLYCPYNSSREGDNDVPSFEVC